jgi:regulator of protease activity HflC (stomatin/prohibitin superfamily)
MRISERVGNMTLVSMGLVIIVGFVILLAALGSWYTIDQGDRGVLLRNGKFVEVVEPGLGFKFPFIDTVKEISLRDFTFTFDKIEAYSHDQQPAHLRLSIIWRVPPDKVAKVYESYGTRVNLQQMVIERKAIDESKKVFGQFNAASAVQKRRELVEAIENKMKEELAFAPVDLIGVQLEDISFSQAYTSSIESRMLAEVQIETTTQQKKTSQIAADMQVIKATGEAEAKRQQYKAEADGIRIRGEAEATAIEARAKALAQNTNLVNLSAVEKWDGKLSQTMVPGSTVPFLDLNFASQPQRK